MASTLTRPRIAGVIEAGVNASSTQTTSSETNVLDQSSASPPVGESTGNVSKAYSATLSLSTSGQTLNLASLTDPLGASITFTLVRSIKITNRSTASGEDLSIGGGASNDFIALLPFTLNSSSSGDAFLLINFGSDGQVVDSSHRNLLLDVAAGSTVPVDVTIIGY